MLVMKPGRLADISALIMILSVIGILGYEDKSEGVCLCSCQAEQGATLLSLLQDLDGLSPRICALFSICNNTNLICSILPLYPIRSKLFHFASEYCGRSRGICSSAKIPFLVISVLVEIRGQWRIWSCPHRIIITVWTLTLCSVIWLVPPYGWNFRSVPSRLLKQASYKASACYIRLFFVSWGCCKGFQRLFSN